MFLETGGEEGYPAAIKIAEKESSLVVYVTVKAAWGKLTSPNLCSFYDEFGKNIKQASLRAQVRQPAFSFQNLSKGVKESSLPSPCPAPSSPSPPEPAPKMSPPILPQGKVVWVYVNIREGPGTQYKVIGKAYMKSSFVILTENPGWVRVRLENGTEGWVSKKAVVSDSSTTSSSQGSRFPSRDSLRSNVSSKTLSPM